ncbi:matrixin family metalloprotease [Kordia sp. YSTF-M3]|uniref:Matrixin family metalloprotease n=1 Tax=Kordia aestuariivivens TaxID=2759037 RepID=A0ABR7Q7X2_9FLAO|nr:matrixin family metalloprotease [Kordia aestuariivivens]MBC8754666.1 matrixin family metalloprotease [Kordia aestuariivivens]
MKKQFSLLLFLIIGVFGFAQECSILMTPLSIQERTNEATHIIEGKVMASNAYWDVNKHNIYTVHTISTYKSFKGQSNVTFKVVTKGGKVDDHFQLTSSSAHLQPGMEGTFFMKNFRGQLAIAESLYELVGAAQGVVKYDKFTDKASDTFSKYSSLDGELYPSIRRATGYMERILQARPLQNRTMAILANPIVYSFSPLTATAGTQTVFTITGTNFGTDTGTVSFTNANDGGATYTTALDSQILSWSNTEIQVEIPYLAGTGSIVVTNTDNSSTTTTVPLTITYSHLNGTNGTVDYPSTLQDDNGSGGFTFDYHTDFDTSAAKTYFEGAFELWNCESGINFIFGSTTSTDQSIDDGINIVRFDNGSELASGVLGEVTTRYAGSCGTTGRAIVNEIDITWNDSTNWYYGSGDPSASEYDFKTVALHELGHAHQLGHVIDTDLIMHYSLGAGENKYNLGTDDINASVYTMSVFTQSPGCSITEMSSITLCCDDIIINTAPQDSDAAEDGSVQLTAAATNYDSVQWYVSTDGGTNYSTLSDDSNYSGTNSTTLTISNTPLSFDGYRYAAYFTNVCSETSSTSAATLTVTAYTAIPDANFEAALEALGYDDITSDGKVPTSLIESITSLNVENLNISDITGIEDFVALQELTIADNSITSLDLSNNLAIESIYAGNNQLTSINISNNTLLERLWVHESNLTSIDLSNNTALQVLSVSNNNLTSLDVSNNTAIYNLFASYNSLTSINVSNNTALQQFHVISNSLTALDVTNNTSMTNFQFHFNNLTEIDLSNNPALSFLSGRDNNLTSLDVSNNPVLAKIWCGGNVITSIDITNNPLITVFQMGGNALTYANLQNGANTNITGFSLANNPNLECITVDDAAYSTTNWTSVDATTSFSEEEYCSYTTIPDANFEAALEALGYDDISSDGQVPTVLIEVITNLNLSNRSIADLTGIEDFTALQKLNASDNNLTSVDLTNNTNLEELNISDNVNLTSLDVSSCVLLERINAEDNAFSTLDLSANTQLDALFVTDNDALTEIDLTTNSLLRVLTLDNLDNIASVDISQNVLMDSLKVTNNIILSDFNIKNGANTDIFFFLGNNNSSLTCILVDDASYSTSSWSAIDSQASFSDTYCRYTAIPDANFETALEALITDDVSGDGQVPTVLIEVLTSLDVRTLNISDLTGIEDFVSLEALYCSDNNLTSLHTSNLVSLQTLWAVANDLTTIDLTNNPDITDIRIEENNLTSIDLSNQTNLAILQIDRNELTSIDVSNSPSITRFRAYSNTISVIDLSNNPLLQEVRVSGNVLLSLNVQNGNNTNISNFSADDNEFLECILVDDASYSNTNWTAIDSQTIFNETACAIAYTAIPDTIFEATLEGLGYDDISGDGQVPTVYIEGVTSLDVSSLGVSDLTGIEDFTALVDLDAEVNNLTSLDLSTNLLIETIDLDSNDLVTLTLPANGSLVTFICNNNPNLTTVDFSGNTNLQTIQCGSNGLTSVNLNGLSALSSLALSGNSLSTIDISSATNLATFVIGNNTLTNIDLSNNTSLTYLNVESNNLSSLDISNNTALEYLILSENNITSIDVSSHTALVWLYAGNNLLTTIDVSSNILLEKLWVNENQLTSIDVSSNIILKELVCYNNSITSIDVSGNSFLSWFLVNDNALTSVNLQSGNNTNITNFASYNNPNLACVLVDDASYSNTNWTLIDNTTSFNETTCSTEYTVAIDVFLQGAALNPNTGEENLMRDDLRVAGLIPTTSPYTDGLTCEATVFDTTGNDAIVDWILIEVRDATDNTIVVHSQSALLQRDGDVVDVDGVSDVTLTLDSDTYYIAVQHRNHLGVMTATAVTLISGSINFTDANAEITYGSNAQTSSGMPSDVIAMWAGDCNEDNSLQYSGTSPDTPNILSAVLNDAGNFLNFPTYSITAYNTNDANMDGIIQYSGTNPDTPFVLQNVLAHPSNFLGFSTYQIIEQLPENTSN